MRNQEKSNQTGIKGWTDGGGARVKNVKMTPEKTGPRRARPKGVAGRRR